MKTPPLSGTRGRQSSGLCSIGLIEQPNVHETYIFATIAINGRRIATSESEAFKAEDDFHMIGATVRQVGD